MAETTIPFDRIKAENRVLNRIIDLLSSTTALDALLSQATTLILEATGADACFIHLLDDRTGGLVLKAASPPYEQQVDRVRLALGEGVAGWVAEHRQVVVIPTDKWNDPRYKFIPELGGDKYTSLVSAPLMASGGRLVGVMNIHTEQRRDFTDAETESLAHVGSLLAASIEHAELFGELEAKEQMLQGVIERTIQAQEEERRRVAIEIHDGVTQQLISIWYRMNACERLLDKDTARAREELEVAKGLIDEALEEARAAIYDLRPATLDDLGLVPALEALASRTLDPGVEFSISSELESPLPSHLETALYRISQEAINNVRKHSRAKHVVITIRSDLSEEVELSVEDDGTGFDAQALRATPSDTSFGITGMAERVNLVRGVLKIDSAPGRGTRVEVKVPLSKVGAQ